MEGPNHEKKRRDGGQARLRHENHTIVPVTTPFHQGAGEPWRPYQGASGGNVKIRKITLSESWTIWDAYDRDTLEDMWWWLSNRQIEIHIALLANSAFDVQHTGAREKEHQGLLMTLAEAVQDAFFEAAGGGG